MRLLRVLARLIDHVHETAMRHGDWLTAEHANTDHDTRDDEEHDDGEDAEHRLCYEDQA